MSPAGQAAPGAVVVRSADRARVLQGLRTALSLSMGDRPAALYVAATSLPALTESPSDEVQACLEALPEAGVAILVEGEAGKRLPVGARRVSRPQLLLALASAEFQQTF